MMRRWMHVVVALLTGCLALVVCSAASSASVSAKLLGHSDPARKYRDVQCGNFLFANRR